MYKIDGAHLQCVNNHYAKFEYKKMKTVGVTDYANQTHPYAFRMEKMSKFNTCKNKKIFIKCAQNMRCTSSMCEQSLCSLKIKKKKTVGVTDYTNQKPSKHFWTEKCLSSTTLKIGKISMKCAQYKKCKSSICEQSSRVPTLFSFQIQGLFQAFSRFNR